MKNRTSQQPFFHKRRYSILTGTLLFLIAAAAVIGGCKKEDPAPDTSTIGKIQFFQRTQQSLGTLSVYIDGSYEGSFSNVDADGADPYSCEINGFSADVAKGSHDYRITSSAVSTVWTGTVSIKGYGLCTTTEIIAGNGGGGGSTEARAMFYTSSDLGNITVTVSGATAHITQYYPGTAPDCGATGCANFSLGIGTHSWTATNGTLNWSGTTTVTLGGCAKNQLTSSGGGGGGTTGNFTAWIQSDLGHGLITVHAGGQSQTIYSYYGSRPACGTIGCANFTLPAGTYSVTASAADGTTWNPYSMTVIANDCVLLRYY